MAGNPLVPQGTLNRVRTAIVFSNYPALNITAPYMGASFAQLSFAGQYGLALPTGTGVVTSNEPYVMANVTVGLLKSQALAQEWLSQVQLNCAIGPVTTYGDSATIPPIYLDNCIVTDWEPSAYDGKDPVIRLTIHGVFYTNSSMWI